LVAKSGFTVYEPGASVFDESVLVFLATMHDDWPDYQVLDHVGRPLAYSKFLGRDEKPWSRHRSPTVFSDPLNNEIFQLLAKSGFGDLSFEVSGVSSGQLVRTNKRDAHLTLMANKEPYGAVAGGMLTGLSASELRIFDDAKREVGAIRRFREGTRGRKVDNYVVSIQPGLRGELRRMLVVVPTVITTALKLDQRSS
jgi:hypothetical protein